jgi:hypothetical protein
LEVLPPFQKVKISSFTFAYWVYGLIDLMMQLILIILTNRKEMIRYSKSFRYGGTTLSNIITNDLTYVSVPAEDG